MTPTQGIAIDINGAQNNEGRSEHQSQTQQKTLPAMRVPRKDRPEAIAGGHHPDPGKYRISGHEVDSMKCENILLVEDVPNPGSTPEALGGDRVQQIVEGNDRDTQPHNDAHGKINQPGKGNHGNADRPKDDEDDRIRRIAYLRKEDQPQ